jgi:hypothetical protein
MMLASSKIMYFITQSIKHPKIIYFNNLLIKIYISNPFRCRIFFYNFTKLK